MVVCIGINSFSTQIKNGGQNVTEEVEELRRELQTRSKIVRVAKTRVVFRLNVGWLRFSFGFFPWGGGVGGGGRRSLYSFKI